MDRMIFTAMTGARQAMGRQDALAQNLANASTTGYRAATYAARSVPVAGGANPTRAFSLETTTGADLAAGPIQRTGRELDVAVDGNAWLAVQGRDGREAYTRAGSLQVDANGVLNSGGNPVLSDSGPIMIPADTTISVARDGTISAVPNTGSLNAVVQVGRIKLASIEPGQAVRGDDGLFRTKDGNPAPADDRATLTSGALEGSNVNPVESMVGMISAARAFEMQMKMISTAEANARAAAQLLSVSN